MSASRNRTLDRIAAGGLLVGVLFGLAGTLVTSPALQDARQPARGSK